MLAEILNEPHVLVADSANPDVYAMYEYYELGEQTETSVNAEVLNSDPDGVVDLSGYYVYYQNIAPQVQSSFSNFSQIAAMQCMCPAEMGMSGMLYSAQSSYVNYMNPSEVGDGHKHGHCSKHPEAHFEEGEKCPECG